MMGHQLKAATFVLASLLLATAASAQDKPNIVYRGKTRLDPTSI